MNESLEFLSKIFDLLKEEKVFDTESEQHKSVIDFKHPDELRKIINVSLDSVAQDDDDLIELCRKVIKYSVKTNNRNFHNQLFGGSDLYGVAAEWLTTSLNTSQYTYEMAPAFTLIENELIRKSLELFGFKNGDGILCPGGSVSNKYGIHLARFKKYPQTKTEGNPPGLVMFTSEHAHYSLAKAASFLGIGVKNLVLVKTNQHGQILLDDLEMKINEAISKKLRPFVVNATCGTTVLGAFDDLIGIADICEKYDLWLHVDACLGGSLIFSSKRKHLLNGIERANSLSWNPHKTLGVPLQCSIFLVNQKGLLHECNSSSANYLFQQDKFYDESFDTGDKSLSCGRKVDAFKFWLIWKKRGRDGLEMLVENAFEMTEYLRSEILARENFELVVDKSQYTNVCFCFIPKSMRNKQPRDELWWKVISRLTTLIKEKMVMNGNVMVSYMPVSNDKNVGNFFRMVVTTHPQPTRQSMTFVLDQIEKIAENLEINLD